MSVKEFSMENTGYPHAKLGLALSKAQSKYKPLNKSKEAKIKTRTGGEYSYFYADLADLLEATRGALMENELAISQPIKGDILYTYLIHSSGEFVESYMPLPKGLSNQELGSALTYLRRYSLSSILGIAGEEDDDGQAGEQKPTPQPTKPPAETKPLAKPDRPLGVISLPQAQRLHIIAKENGWDEAKFKATLKEFYNVESTKQISAKIYDEVCKYFQTNRGDV
jgi:ERF superfamily